MITDGIKRYVDTVVQRSEKNIVNFSAEAKLAKELGDSVTKVYTNTATKTIVCETIDNNSYKTININPSAGTISLSHGTISGISDNAGGNSTIALSQRSLINVQEQLDKKADKDHDHDDVYSKLDHTHTTNDITDYEPYDDTEVRELIDERVTKKLYTSMDDIINDWSNIPDNTIVLSTQGADTWSATFTYKYNEHRSLSFTIPKDEKDYLWTRFQGSSNNAWSNASVWRKIPVLTTSDNLVCNNVKEDNEIRLKNLEETSSTKDHTHTIADITDYETPAPYDDTELRTKLNACETEMANKANKIHKHAIADVDDLQSTLNAKADKIHTHDDRYAPIISYPTIEDMTIE